MVIEDFQNPNNEARRLYRAQAQAWLARPAQRLGISAEAIDAAIRRNGWLPAEVEKARSAAELLRRRR